MLHKALAVHGRVIARVQPHPGWRYPPGDTLSPYLGICISYLAYGPELDLCLKLNIVKRFFRHSGANTQQ